MKFHLKEGQILKGLNTSLTNFPQEILMKIPRNTHGLNTHVQYNPKITCFIDLEEDDIDNFAKMRALETYLKHNNIDATFLYKPLPPHKFDFHVNENLVRVSTYYFYSEYIIEAVQIDGDKLNAKIKEIYK
ncbi:MAG: hypothetical protein H6850_03325 [Alphaproteobacteria bacterium]|nr:MAG: hypothetical protein H6850_03325 [Alphaproteobacteria bacterium]